MPVNLFPIFAFVVAAWLVVGVLLARWTRRAALTFVGCTAVVIAAAYQLTGVRRPLSEEMPYRTFDVGTTRWVEFTGAAGEKYSSAIPSGATHLEEKAEKKAKLVGERIYDFGRMRSYSLTLIDDVPLLRKMPNKAPEPTPVAVTPRATEGASK